VGNKPEIAKMFGDKDLKDFVLNILFDIENRDLKEFLVKGSTKFLEEYIKQLSNSFTVIEAGKTKDDSYIAVERSIDGLIFKLNEKVRIRGEILPICRLYEDDRGLHVRLDYPERAIGWAYLGDLKKVR
jgi:hypothetical protein